MLPQPVTRFAGLTVPDSVREDKKVSCGVKQCTGAKQFTSKLRAHKLGTAPASAVHDEHGVTNDALPIALRLAKCPVVQPQLGQPPA
jgi:hypothetical protein